MRKHIVCPGDSNTHGYCAESRDCADGCEMNGTDHMYLIARGHRQLAERLAEQIPSLV